MDRRTFLIRSGRWLALASLTGVAPLLPSCGAETTSTTTAGLREEGSPTTTADSSSTSGGGTSMSDTGSPGDDSTAPTASGSTAATAAVGVAGPDLAVIKGDSVDKNVRTAVALLGGMGRFVKKGGKVVVKPNVLTGRPPEYATTTSPELMRAVIAMCWEAGAKEVVVFDNPTSDARSSFKTAGLAQAVSDCRRQAGLSQQSRLSGLRHPPGQGHHQVGLRHRGARGRHLHQPRPAQAALHLRRHDDHEEPHGRHGRQAGHHPLELQPEDRRRQHPGQADAGHPRRLPGALPQRAHRRLAGRRPPGQDPGGGRQPGLHRRLRHAVLRQDRRRLRVAGGGQRARHGGDRPEQAEHREGTA